MESAMSMWLYQIDAQNWSPQRYRVEIWEGERWAWPVGQKRLSGHEPQTGDIVVFYNTPSGGTDYGFYGWAIILDGTIMDLSYILDRSRPAIH